MNFPSFALIFLLLCSGIESKAQLNYYFPDSQSNFNKWPILSAGNHIYYQGNHTDSISGGLAVTSYYFYSVNILSRLLEKRVVICRDTTFNIKEGLQPAPVYYSMNPINKRISFFYILDKDSSTNAYSILQKYPKTIYYRQFDSSLNTVIGEKAIIRFNEISRYSFFTFDLPLTDKNSVTTIKYLVGDTMIANQSTATIAAKILQVDDTGRILYNKFIGWEPLGSGTYFAWHRSPYAIYKDENQNAYFTNVMFANSFGTNRSQFYKLDSALNLVDTFDFSDVQYTGIPLTGKTNIGFGGFVEHYLFLPTGSLIRSAIGSYTSSAQGSKEYVYYAVAKSNQSTGYRPASIYFPPVSDSGDFFHNSGSSHINTIYNAHDNLLYTFTSTHAEYDGNYCFNGQPNKGQIAAIDTNLQERWVKYIVPHPGNCIKAFSIAAPDKRNGVIVSGLEYRLPDLSDSTGWRPFIYEMDSSSRLGIDHSQSPFTLRDRFLSYPNPVTQTVTVDDLLGKLSEICITNMQGQVVYKQSAQGFKVVLNLSSFPPGLYMLRAHTNDNNWYSTKINKQ